MFAYLGMCVSFRVCSCSTKQVLPESTMKSTGHVHHSSFEWCYLSKAQVANQLCQTGRFGKEQQQPKLTFIYLKKKKKPLFCGVDDHQMSREPGHTVSSLKCDSKKAVFMPHVLTCVILMPNDSKALLHLQCCWQSRSNTWPC